MVIRLVLFFFFFSSRRRHTRCLSDWSSDVCSSDLSALVTSGAAAAIESGLAGILTGENEDFIHQIPDLTGMKSEVIIQKSHRNPFDHQLRNTGIKLIVIETREELKAAINERTAMMHFSNFANAAGQIK